MSGVGVAVVDDEHSWTGTQVVVMFALYPTM